MFYLLLYRLSTLMTHPLFNQASLCAPPPSQSHLFHLFRNSSYRAPCSNTSCEQLIYERTFKPSDTNAYLMKTWLLRWCPQVLLTIWQHYQTNIEDIFKRASYTVNSKQIQFKPLLVLNIYFFASTKSDAPNDSLASLTFGQSSTYSIVIAR